MKLIDTFLEKTFRITFSDFPNLPKFIKNTSWLFWDNILRACVGFLLGIWMARQLGPEQWGMYCYAFSFTTIFSILGMLGLDSVAIRNLVKDPQSKNKILGTTLGLKLIGTLFAFLLCILTICFFSPKNQLIQLLTVIMASGILFQSFDIIDFYFQSQIKVKYSVVVKNGIFLFMAGVKIYLLLNSYPLTAFAWAVAFEWVFGGIGLTLIYSKLGNEIRKLKFDHEVAVNLLKNAWPLLLSGIMGILYLKLDVLMIGQMLTLNELGQYSLAIWLAESLYFVPVIIMKSFSIKMFESSKDHFFIKEILFIMNIISFFIIIIFWLTSPHLLSLLGKNYQAAIPFMNLLIINIFFLGLGLTRNPYLVKINRTHIHFLIEFMGVLLNFILNLALIHYFRIYGAVISKLVTFLFVCVFANLLFKETRIIFTEQIKSLFFIQNHNKC